MDWIDDVGENTDYRQCLLDSVEQQGGTWKDDTFCSPGSVLDCSGDPVDSTEFWPDQPATPSSEGVILHTHNDENHAYRVPVDLYAVLPGSWHVVNGFVTWYCNGYCNDGGAGGCSARDGGIMDWMDNVGENRDYRQCLLDSVAQQGGQWHDNKFCNVAHGGSYDCSAAPVDSAKLWPTETKTPSASGVILHTHNDDNHAYRVPVDLYSVLPGSWYIQDGYVTWYCNGYCNDGGAGGCSARGGGIMDWMDNVGENTDYRQCLLDSVAQQGGAWNDNAFC